MHRIILLCLALCVPACSSKSQTPSASPPAPAPAPSKGDCIKTGCSGTVCAAPGEEVVTTCEFKAEYGCYQQAKCERQPNGLCGWTQSANLTACLANPPPM